MKVLTRFMAITGALLIVAALVAHIVSFATPYLASMDVHTFAEKLNHTLKEMIDDGQGEEAQNLARDEQFNPAMFGEGAYVHFGVWTFCLKGTIMSTTPMEVCFQWGSALPEEGTIEVPGWMNGVRGCYITGLVLAVLAVIISNTNAHTPSQGDRRRILPIFICILSFLTGIVIFIGNLIAVTSYTDVTFPGDEKLPQAAREKLRDILGSALSVNWGFALDLTSALVFIVAGAFHLFAGRFAHREDKIRRNRDDMETSLPNYDENPL